MRFGKLYLLEFDKKKYKYFIYNNYNDLYDKINTKVFVYVDTSFKRL